MTEPEGTAEVLTAIPVGARTAGAPVPAVVLLPGLGAGGAMWGPVLAHLDRHRTFDPFDAILGPPVAETAARVPGSRTVDALGKAVARHLRALPYRGVAVVGHSLGALLAVDLAARLPALVGAVVLVNGGLAPLIRLMDRPVPGIGEHRRSAFAAAALAAGVCLPVPRALRHVIAERDAWALALFSAFAGRSVAMDRRRREPLVSLLGHPEAARGLLANRHHWPRMVDDASRVRQPVSLLGGDQDPIAPRPATDATADLFSRSHVTYVPDRRHVLPLEDPQAVAGAVDDAVRSVASRHSPAASQSTPRRVEGAP